MWADSSYLLLQLIWQCDNWISYHSNYSKAKKQYDIEKNDSDILRADIMYLMLQLIWQCDNWIFYYNKPNMT